LFRRHHTRAEAVEILERDVNVGGAVLWADPDKRRLSSGVSFSHDRAVRVSEKDRCDGKEFDHAHFADSPVMAPCPE
jgi:hypothetical protein